MHARAIIRECRTCGIERDEQGCSRRCGCACHFRRVDMTTAGFNENLQTFGGDFAASMNGTGLRIPVLPHVTYRLLCAKVNLDEGDRIVGVIPWLVIAARILPAQQAGGAFILPKHVETPSWCFQDTPPVCWTITRRKKTSFRQPTGPLDQLSFRLRDTDDCAVVYETATIPGAPILPGYLGLTAYAPPKIIGAVQFVWRDVRGLWNHDGASHPELCADGPEEWRVYADVFQTDPNVETGRFQPNLPTNGFTPFISPEDGFVAYCNTLSSPARYHTAGVRVVVDKRGGR